MFLTLLPSGALLLSQTPNEVPVYAQVNSRKFLDRLLFSFNDIRQRGIAWFWQKYGEFIIKRARKSEHTKKHKSFKLYCSPHIK
jgi:hypothetical protein